ncbi:MAG: hypothetical protein JST92_08060, partial [Deltaproteobacteria bacterium]|nr:hypothetical protein [Deltaproteobacteria bacterium]
MTIPAAAGASWLGDSLTPGARGVERWLGRMVSFAALATASIVALGALGHLRTGAVAALACGLAGLLWCLRRSLESRRLPGPDSQAERPWIERPDDPGKGAPVWMRRAAAIALAAALGPLLARTVPRGTTFFWDDLSYHATAIAHWVSEAGFSDKPFAMQLYFPMNAEAFATWVILPFRGDTWASLTGLFWVVILGLAVACLARLQGTEGPQTTLVVALALVTPEVVDAARTVCAHDLCGPSMVLAGIALLGPLPARPRRGAILLAGLAVGFAVGARVSMWPAAGAVALSLAATAGTRRQRLGDLALFTAGLLSLGGFWYARNALWTGNPLFPAATGPFAGPFGPVEQARTKLITWLASHPTDGAQWWLVAREHLSWPATLALVAVALVVTSLRSRLRGGSSAENRQGLDTEALLLLVCIVACLAYPFTPFSGTNNNATAPLRIERRFVLLPFLAALSLSPRARGLARARPEVTFGAVAVLLLSAAAVYPSHLVASIGCAGVTALVWGRLRWPRRPPRAVLTGLGSALALLAMGALTPLEQRLTNRSLARSVGDVWEAFEHLRPGARITWFGGTTAAQYYPLFGRRYQLVP